MATRFGIAVVAMLVSGFMFVDCCSVEAVMYLVRWGLLVGSMLVATLCLSGSDVLEKDVVVAAMGVATLAATWSTIMWDIVRGKRTLAPAFRGNNEEPIDALLETENAQFQNPFSQSAQPAARRRRKQATEQMKKLVKTSSMPVPRPQQEIAPMTSQKGEDEGEGADASADDNVPDPNSDMDDEPSADENDDPSVDVNDEPSADANDSLVAAKAKQE